MSNTQVSKLRLGGNERLGKKLGFPRYGSRACEHLNVLLVVLLVVVSHNSSLLMNIFSVASMKTPTTMAWYVLVYITH